MILNESYTATAAFVKVWSLTVDGNEGGTVEGSSTVDAGVPSLIVATASECYRFHNWVGEGISDVSMPQTTITVNADTTATAAFVKVWGLEVTATEGGNAEGGGTFDSGEEVAIMADPSEGYRFGGWQGEGVADPSSLETTITVNAETTAQATF